MTDWHHTLIYEVHEKSPPPYLVASNELALIGNALRRERIAQQRTQENIAECANISTRYYQSLEAGKSAVGVLIIFKLCRALDCHYTQLLESAWEYKNTINKTS